MKLWERVDYSAIIDRTPLHLPNKNTVAVWPLVTVEVWDPDEALPRTILTPPQGMLFIPDVPQLDLGRIWNAHWVLANERSSGPPRIESGLLH
jgi:hypothetical protein